MLKLEPTVLDKLPSIDIDFNEEDSPSGFLQSAGIKFPVIQIGDTVLAAKDIRAFKISIGKRLPELIFSFNDSDRAFRTSELLENETKVLVFVGSLQSEETPIKLLFDVYDVLTNSSSIKVFAKLSIFNASDKIQVEPNSCETLLEQLVKLCHLGLQCSIDTSLTLPDSLIDLTVLDAFEELSKLWNCYWFIDEHWVVHFDEIKEIIDSFEQQTISKNFIDDRDLPRNFDVKFSNSIDEDVLFAIIDYNIDYMYKDSKTYEYEEIRFSKSFTPSLEKQQVSESENIKTAKNYDTVALLLTMDYNPYMFSGTSVNVEIYTKPFFARRVSNEEFRSNDENKDTQPMFIEDYSGIFYVSGTSYRWGADDEAITMNPRILKIL